MTTTGGTKSAHSAYQLQLFSNLPLYTTQLVCETKFPFCERLQVSAPLDVVPLLQEYFLLKDREEMILVLLDTANTILGLSLVSVGGLAASIVEPRQVFKVAILANAAAVILAHNHPSQEGWGQIISDSYTSSPGPKQNDRYLGSRKNIRKRKTLCLTPPIIPSHFVLHGSSSSA